MKNLLPAWQSFHQHQEKWHRSLGIVPLSLPTGEGLQAEYPKGEAWRYVDFSNLRKESFVAFKGKDVVTGSESDSELRLEFSDFSGPFDFALTGLPKGLQVLTHGQDLKRQDSLLNRVKELPETTPLARIADEFLGSGVVLRAQAPVDKDVHIVLNLDGHQGQGRPLVVFHLLVEACRGANLRLFLDLRGQNFSGHVHVLSSLWLAEGSQVSFYRQQKIEEQGFAVQSLQARVDRDALLTAFDVKHIGGWSRHDSTVDLIAPSARVEMRGLDFNHGDDFSDHHTRIHHKKPQTESLQDYRGLLSGQSRGVFNGQVVIAHGASQSQSQQVNKNLMLSKKAEIDTKPELQIDNDDVKASHGATVGQIDPDQLFYLCSRGYRREQALESLCRAFALALFEGLDESVAEVLLPGVNQSLSQLKEP